ncbi:TonB family protein [candidate division KSB1 bacterium]
MKYVTYDISNWTIINDGTGIGISLKKIKDKSKDIISTEKPQEKSDIPTFLPIEDQPKLIGGMQAIYDKLVYPEEAIKVKIEGKVTVRVLVGLTGLLEEIEVIRSSGNKLLDDAAVKACREGARYTPAQMRSKPVKFRITHRIVFRLTDDKKETKIYELPRSEYLDLKNSYNMVYGKLVDPGDININDLREIIAVKIDFDDSRNAKKVTIIESSGNKQLDDAFVYAFMKNAFFKPDDIIKTAEVGFPVKPIKERLNAISKEGKSQEKKDIPLFMAPEDQPKLIGGMQSIYDKLVYPEEAIKENIEGTVTLRVLVGTTGKPEKVETYISSGNKLLDDAAVKACRDGARYVQVIQEGKPVKYKVIHRMFFKLTDDKKEPVYKWPLVLSVSLKGGIGAIFDEISDPDGISIKDLNRNAQIEIDFDESGKPLKVRIIESTGSKDLDDALIPAYMKKGELKVKGKSETVRMSVPIIPIVERLSRISKDEKPQEKSDIPTFLPIEDQPKLKGGLESIYKKIKHPVRIIKDFEKPVLVRILVDEKGLPEEVEILRSSGDKNLDEAVKKACLDGARYTPAKQDGKPVKFRVMHRLVYKPDVKKNDPEEIRQEEDQYYELSAGWMVSSMLGKTPGSYPAMLKGGLESIFEHLKYPVIEKKGFEKSVEVGIIVNKNGVPEDIKILKSSGFKELDSAVRKACQEGARYQPAKKGGKPAEFRVRHRINFKADVNDNNKIKLDYSVPQAGREILADNIIHYFQPGDSPQLIGGLQAIYDKLIYPEEAIKSKIEGTTVLEVLVGETGMPEEVKVTNTSFSKMLDDAAVKACREGAKYKPAKKDGKPVKSYVVHWIRFELPDGEIPGYLPEQDQPKLIGGMLSIYNKLVYPEIAQRAKREGKVAVRVLVDTDGKPEEVLLWESSGNKALDNAALEACWEGARYTPAKKDRKPVKFWITHRIIFKLNDLEKGESEKEQGNEQIIDRDKGETDGIPVFLPLQDQPKLVGGMKSIYKILVYPEIAQKSKSEGAVTVRVLVGTDGNPQMATVAKSSGNLSLDEAAVKACWEGARYKPARQRGKPVKFWITHRINFKLSDD